MAWAFMVDPATGNVGLYDEPVGTGDPADPDSARNAPLNNPGANLAHLYWHILLDSMEVVSDTVVSINHATIDAAAGSLAGDNVVASDFDANGNLLDWDMGTHGLGYEPLVLIAIGQNMITPGYPVQVPGSVNGSARYVSPYVTTNKVFIREFQSRGASALAGLSIDYRVLVFKRQPVADGTGQLIDWNPATGELRLGEGRFSNKRRYLQVVPGGTPFGLVYGRTIDLQNGACRLARADGSTYDPVPTTTKTGVWFGSGQFASDTLTYGASMAYDGTWAPGEILEVQAP